MENKGRKRFDWDEEKEKLVLHLRDKENLTYKQIAERIGFTSSSIKHKYVRLKQAENVDEYHHPDLKLKQLTSLVQDSNLRILETHGGFGNLSQYYSERARTHLILETKKERVEHLKATLPSSEVIKCDSFLEIHRLVYERKKFDVIDIDPYGYPSRMFPHVLELMTDGLLIVTFPKVGVQKLNKLAVEHLRVFWGYEKGADFVTCVKKKFDDFQVQTKREIELINILDLGRLYRLAFRVKKASAFEIVGLDIEY